LDQLAATINKRGDGLLSSDLLQAQKMLGNYDLESIKVREFRLPQHLLLTLIAYARAPRCRSGSHLVCLRSGSLVSVRRLDER
jgi:hypothetical protein